jgi:tetratricopeptide (TPR) repeat protein
MIIRILLALLVLLSATSCCRESCDIDPEICFYTPPHIIEDLPSAFPPLSPNEIDQDWGKELLIANHFAKQNDLYRAITGYKRALILIPKDQTYRLQQIEYDIILAYYLGEKYQEAVEAFEISCLTNVSNRFLAFDNLLRIIYDSYEKVGNSAKAEKVLDFLKKSRPEIADEFEHLDQVVNADFCALDNIESPYNEKFYSYLTAYNENAKSVKKAKTLNALLPGAGYYYVGQKNTAITALIVNSLFIGAAYYFFDNGNWPAGLITTSLEMGWYFGGINGAGHAAREYNSHLYEGLAKDYLIHNKIFPVLNFQTSF